MRAAGGFQACGVYTYLAVVSRHGQKQGWQRRYIVRGRGGHVRLQWAVAGSGQRGFSDDQGITDHVSEGFVITVILTLLLRAPFARAHATPDTDAQHRADDYEYDDHRDSDNQSQRDSIDVNSAVWSSGRDGRRIPLLQCPVRRRRQ